MENKELENMISEKFKAIQTQSMAFGAKAAAMTILEKIESHKKANPKKSDLQATITDIKNFCKEFCKVDIPKTEEE